MKKLTSVVFVLLIIIILSGCNSTVTSENGFDLSDLDACIDEMVSQDSPIGCLEPGRTDYLEAYIHSFETSFDPTGTEYNQAGIDFSTSRTDDATRVEYWFMYSLLSEAPTNNYTTFKDIVKTMLLDMREINSGPEYLITGEFFSYGDIYYIFRTDANDDLEGEIQVHKSQGTLTEAVTEIETYLDTYGIDTELETQILDLLASDYSVYIVVDVATSEYQYKVYRQTSDENLSLAQVEALVESTLNDESLTKVAWTID